MKSGVPRMTMPTRALLRVLLAEPARERYGLELCDLAGLPGGTVYPILARLEQLGWMESRWEDPGTHEKAGRPRRRYYRLTPDGAERARDAVARAHRSRPRTTPLRPARPGEAS
ncbi:PadR family transcriptional regulator [Nonomuraea sp. NPDC050783]|uniref:PadR family transcriptional regulator n=1 Tax=Nonomuraea sp. NPDC050783 TaxID=3154634 RepID=UPI003465D5B0